MAPKFKVGALFELTITIIMNTNKYITVKDYAFINGITEKTVYNRIKSGAIPKENVKKVLSTTLIKC